MNDIVAHALATIGILAGLCACASPEEIRAADEAACRGYGFAPNTSEFADCLRHESVARQYAPPPMAQYGPPGYGPGWWGYDWYKW